MQKEFRIVIILICTRFSIFPVNNISHTLNYSKVNYLPNFIFMSYCLKFKIDQYCFVNATHKKQYFLLQKQCSYNTFFQLTVQTKLLIADLNRVITF